MITHAPDGSEFVKIIDLGVAKATESDVAMTQTGMFVGKFRYASPDHLGFLAAGEHIDGRADLYSLAIVLFEMVTGRPPFEATSPHAYIIHHSRDEYLNSPDLDRITGSPALQTILARGLDRDRNKRFATAREFADALIAVERDLPDEEGKTVTGTFDPDATMRTERTRNGQTAAAAAMASDIAPPARTVPAQAAPATGQPATVATAAGIAPATIASTVPSSYSPPPPPSAPAPPTIAGTMPGAAPQRSSTGLIIAITLIALLLFGALAVLAVWRFWPRSTVTTTSTTSTTATTTMASAKPSSTTLDVTSTQPVLIDNTTAATTTTSSNPSTVPTTTTARTPPVIPPTTTTHGLKPPPVQPEEPAPAEETAEPEPEPAQSSALTYREKGDGSSNDAALASLHQQIAGTTRVYLSGGDAEMIKQLSDALRGRGITLAEGAPVEVRFTGSVNSHGFGRKSRSGNATIKKNGRPIFQYVMPREDYRVGDSPAEAFARILVDALAR
jgi:hypothetical protein